MVSDYIPKKPPRPYIGKHTVTNTATRSVWSPQPPGPGGRLSNVTATSRTAASTKPVIRSTARIGQAWTYSGNVWGASSPHAWTKQVGGALGRTHYEVMKHHMSTTTAQRAAAHSAKLAKGAKIVKGANIVGLGMIAAEGIYKGTKRALGPGGTEFHTKKSKNKYGTKGY